MAFVGVIVTLAGWVLAAASVGITSSTTARLGMVLVGIVVTFAGFLLAAGSVGISSSNTVRLGLVLVGIVISLVGILGVIHPAYQKNAVWKK